MKTPYYVIHEQELDENYRKLEKALRAHWNHCMIGYSYKTNGLPWLVSHFQKLGACAEVVSEDEYALAKRIGIEENRIIYNGPVKTKESFLEAVKNECMVNLDSQREIDWLEELSKDSGRERYQIGIRVNFDVEKKCPGQSQCKEAGGRFGFCLENGELEKALKKIAAKGIQIKGLHLHTSSKTRGLDIYRAIAETACEIRRKYQLQLSFLDVGGGFFGGLKDKPQFEEYMGQIASILKQEFCPEETTLVVEPGMAVIGAFVSYVTSVIDVKDTDYSRFVVTDGTRLHIDPLMNKQSYCCSIEGNEGNDVLEKQVICGCTCMEHDRLMEVLEKPEIKTGSRITYERTGAYTMSLAPLFITYFPAVYVERDGVYQMVRKAWTAKEYMQGSVAEEEDKGTGQYRG